MSGQERTTLVIILAIVISFGIAYFGLKPALISYHDARVAVGARGEEINNLTDRKTALVQLGGLLKKYDSQIKLLNLAVPPEPQYPELLAQLAAMAEESGLTLTSLQPQSSDLTNTASVPVNLTVRGSFPNMVGFAGKIETNLRPATVLSISLVGNGDPDSTKQLTATIQLRFARTAALITTGGK